MSDDFIKVNPKVGPIEFDFNAFWRWLTRKKKETNPVELVAQRCLQIFTDHGVAIPQIPRLLPKINLKDLHSAETLLPALTCDVLEDIAKLFCIRREWLEGVGDSIYDCLFCYKAPERFFEDLAMTKVIGCDFPVRALTCVKSLDCNAEGDQPIVLILAQKITELGDEDIFRYRIYCDAWDWGYWKCRIQLKAMVRVFEKNLNTPRPLYRVEESILDQIRDGFRVPRLFLRGSPITEPSLEDYALSKQESAKSKEWEELPNVLEYIRKHELEKTLSICLQGEVANKPAGILNRQTNETPQYDVFISHASEDKETFVRSLAFELGHLGLKVWYDETAIDLGDSLRRKIDEGLAASAFGVVVLSEAFFNKDWPQKELDGLAARERDGKKIILPVYHNITVEQVARRSPLLADRLATFSSKGAAMVAKDIFGVVRLKKAESFQLAKVAVQYSLPRDDKLIHKIDLTDEQVFKADSVLPDGIRIHGKTISAELLVKWKWGLHARPSAKIAQLANRYRCNIMLEKYGERVNAKSILGLMILAVESGARVKLIAEGKNAEDCVAEMIQLFRRNFDME
jgi:phosphotransferase system HPr (HPr) family protein